MAKRAAVAPAPAADTFGGFATAPVIETKKPGKIQKRVAIENVKAVDALYAVAGMCLSVAEDLAEQVKQAGLTYFITDGCERQVRPDNIIGFEDDQEAGIEMRNRMWNSPVPPEEAAICDEHEIPLADRDDTMYAFNPLHTKNADFAAKLTEIEAALKALGLPKDIIIQVGAKTRIASKESVEAAFKLTPDKARLVLPTITTMALRPKFTVVANDISPAIDIAAKHLRLPQLREQLLAALADPNAAIEGRKKGKDKGKGENKKAA
jgi:hypothetical protein